MGLVRPLQPRSAFLEMLAAQLDGRRELGDGQLYRLCRAAPTVLAASRASRQATARRRGGATAAPRGLGIRRDVACDGEQRSPRLQRSLDAVSLAPRRHL